MDNHCCFVCVSVYDFSSLILQPKKLSQICNMLLFLQLEQKGNEIDSFFSSTNKKHTGTPKGNSTSKDKDKEKHVPSIKKLQQDASRKEAAAQKRMQDLIRQFGPILRQVAIFHLLFLFVGACIGRGKYDICVHHYQCVNRLFV
jgi:hypothetical protein